MRCRRSKTSAAGTERIWQKFWLCSVEIRETPFSGYGKTQISTTSFQSSEPEVNWIFGRTPEIGKRCVRSCCPSNHWPIHIFLNASTPEEFNNPRPLGKRHVWTDCDTPRKGFRAKQFGISWWDSDEHSDSQTTNWRQPR